MVYCIDLSGTPCIEIQNKNRIKCNQCLLVIRKNLAWIKSGKNLKFPKIDPFLKRRSNFYGQHFVAMTQPQQPNIILSKDYTKFAKFHAQNQTYDVTNFVSGTYYDLIRIMAQELNFTVSFYKRKDNIWGNFVNGTWTGMFDNLVNGNADMIATSLTRTIDRNLGADFMPDISAEADAIFIKTQSGKT